MSWAWAGRSHQQQQQPLGQHSCKQLMAQGPGLLRLCHRRRHRPTKRQLPGACLRATRFLQQQLAVVLLTGLLLLLRGPSGRQTGWVWSSSHQPSGLLSLKLLTVWSGRVGGYPPRVYPGCWMWLLDVNAAVGVNAPAGFCLSTPADVSRVLLWRAKPWQCAHRLLCVGFRVFRESMARWEGRQGREGKGNSMCAEACVSGCCPLLCKTESLNGPVKVYLPLRRPSTLHCGTQSPQCQLAPMCARVCGRVPVSVLLLPTRLLRAAPFSVAGPLLWCSACEPSWGHALAGGAFRGFAHNTILFCSSAALRAAVVAFSVALPAVVLNPVHSVSCSLFANTSQLPGVPSLECAAGPFTAGSWAHLSAAAQLGTTRLPMRAVYTV